jgi:hypothetical protein
MIGFVILSHQAGGQLHRLVTTLNRLYGDPPIACHHDFSQSSIDVDHFPGNVSFVQPSIRTAWGRMMTVEAALKALELLYADGGPDWFVLLGLSDYPIAPAEKVLSDLASTSADALLDYREVSRRPLNGRAANPSLEHFDREDNRRIAWGWYRATQVWMPWPKRKLDGSLRIGRKTWFLPFADPIAPFDDSFKCYNGSHWFTGSRRAAEMLINASAKHLRLRRHYKRRTIPEESYYQTVLCNSGLEIDRHNRRFEKWKGGGAHPQWLGSADLDEMLASGCHFARKFKPNDPALDQIDEILFTKAKA